MNTNESKKVITKTIFEVELVQPRGLDEFAIDFFQHELERSAEALMASVMTAGYSYTIRHVENGAHDQEPTVDHTLSVGEMPSMGHGLYSHSDVARGRVTGHTVNDDVLDRLITVVHALEKRTRNTIPDPEGWWIDWSPDGLPKDAISFDSVDEFRAWMMGGKS